MSGRPGTAFATGRLGTTDDCLELYLGEAVDVWRVEMVERPRLTRLRAAMRVPGQGWLRWSPVPEGEGTRLLQAARVAPRGLFGLLYWYAMYPAHLFIFGDMAKAVAQLALTEPVVSPPMRARVSHEPLL